jgi:hypothetical protein
VKEGSLVLDSLSVHFLYSKKAIEKHYPRLDPFSLDASKSKRVNEEIWKFLKERGYMIGNNQEDEYP